MGRVSFDHATKRFGEVVALADLSLEVEEGEFLVLVGPSGSGKTTALRLLAGLESLSGGHIRVGERVVDDVPPRDRDIAMVFQDYALYPQMSVYANLSFGLKTRKVPRPEIARRVNEAATALGLDGLLERKPRELSGGQRQRVALGRALVREPLVFLMDEPLSNLDAKLRAQTRGEIKRLQQSIGTTTLYVTHDQVEAMTMGDRIAVMNLGELEQIGEPHAVYDNPANVFVAGFIGSPAMSFARFSAAANGRNAVLGRGELRLETAGASDLPSEVIVGVRPEHAQLWDGESRLYGPLEGRVEFVEALGRETFVGLAAADGVRATLEVEGQARVELGGTVRFGFRPGHVHLFHPETELTIGRV